MTARLYEVTGVKVSFVPGFLLRLKDEQVQPRLQSLQKVKDNLYRVTAHVEFKRGEMIGIPDGGVPKALVSLVAEVGADKSAPPPPEVPTLRHQGFGKYDVVDAAGVVLTEKPLQKAEAQALIDKLTKEKRL
ncbi:MAG: hypothetical protein HY370_04175 [Proteobacteria bacterium]|nr:hypothetical protein [Pseudomonadota bacterium]